MIKETNKGILMVISGPSGAGKGTICKELLEQNKNIWESISMTSRKPRKGEIEGKDYFFVSRESFEKTIETGGLLEYAKVQNNEYYGTPKFNILEKLNKGIDVLLEIDIEGALQVKAQYPETLCIFILPPSMEELKKRLQKRGTETKEKMLERFTKAYQEVNELSKYNYVVINDKVEDAVSKIESILVAERCRVDRIEEVDLGNKEEILHEWILEQ